jgi:hypothetical protein
LLAGASATASAQLVSSALPAAAKAPLLKTQAPAFYRFKIGGIEATVVGRTSSHAGDRTRPASAAWARRAVKLKTANNSQETRIASSNGL